MTSKISMLARTCSRTCRRMSWRCSIRLLMGRSNLDKIVKIGFSGANHNYSANAKPQSARSWGKVGSSIWIRAWGIWWGSRWVEMVMERWVRRSLGRLMAALNPFMLLEVSDKDKWRIRKIGKAQRPWIICRIGRNNIYTCDWWGMVWTFAKMDHIISIDMHLPVW